MIVTGDFDSAHRKERKAQSQFGTWIIWIDMCASAFICVRIYNISARTIKHSCTYIKVGREGNKHCVWDPFP